MYLAAAQMPTWCCLYTVVRSSVDPLSLEPSMRQIVSSLDKDIPVTEVRTMRDLMFRELAQPRFAMVLLGSFCRTGPGSYGGWTLWRDDVLGHAAHPRDRCAHGAGRATWRGAADGPERCGNCWLGVGIGILATLVSSSILRSMLYGTGSRNPLLLMLVCVAVAGPGGSLYSGLARRLHRAHGSAANGIVYVLRGRFHRSTDSGRYP